MTDDAMRNSHRSALKLSAGTMQLLWGTRASRLQFSASGRKHFAAKIQHPLVPYRRAGSRRRAADGGDRDGRAPHFQLHHYGSE